MAKDIEDNWLKDIQMLAGTEPPLLFRVLCIMGETNTAQGSFVREIKGEILKCMDACKKFLGEIRASANNYTMHDLQHSINVIHLMGQLVREPKQMSAIEITSLIYAALLHDIGMVKCQDEANISLDMIRIRHGERSATFIENEVIKDYTGQPLNFGRYHMILKRYLP